MPALPPRASLTEPQVARLLNGSGPFCLVYDYLGNMLGGEGGAAYPQMPTIHVSEGGRWLRAWGADGGSWAG